MLRFFSLIKKTLKMVIMTRKKETTSNNFGLLKIVSSYFLFKKPLYNYAINLVVFTLNVL